MFIIGLTNYFRGKLFVEQGCVHGQKGVVAAVFDGTFAMTVDEDGTLFGLSVRYATDINECFDDVVESVNIVVVQNKVAARVLEDGGFVLR